MSQYLPITINGTDYSNLLEYTGRSETPRKVQGVNAGTARSGDDIYDYLQTKYDLQTSIRPCTPAQLEPLITELFNSETCEVSYFSFCRNTTVVQTMSIQNATATLAILRLYDGETFISNIPLSFRQK